MEFFQQLLGGGHGGFQQPPPHHLHRGASRKPVYFDSLKALPEEYSEKSNVLKNSNKGFFE